MATGGEQYITIGNFNTDATTIIKTINPGKPDFSYYFIDSLSLVQVVCDTGIGIDEQVNNLYLNIYPNPNNGNITLHYVLKSKDIAAFELYDIVGKLTTKINLEPSNNQVQLHTNLSKGIYFYQVTVNERIVKSDKMIIN